MTGLWLRRAVLLAASASSVLLAACGSSTIESALTPSRFIGFGDGFSDVGQTAGGTRHTVNDGSVSLWAEQIAGLADIKNGSAGISKEIDARSFGEQGGFFAGFHVGAAQDSTIVRQLPSY